MLFKITSKVLVFAGTMWLALLPIVEDNAFAGQTIGIAPSLVSVQANKATEKRYPLIVFNDGSQSIRVAANFLDFRLDPNGHVVFLQGQNERRPWSAASWLKLSRSKFTLGPREEKKIWLSITPPPKAEAGTHRALASFTTVNNATDKKSNREVLIKATVSAVVLVKVSGKTAIKPTIKLDVPKINFLSPTAHLTLGNKGNVHYFAQGDLKFENNRGLTQRKISLKRKRPGAMVLPNAKRVFDVSWTKAPYFGSYTAQAIVNISGNRKLIAKEQFYILRWEGLLGVALVLGSMIVAYYFVTQFKLVRKDNSTAADDRINQEKNGRD